MEHHIPPLSDSLGLPDVWLFEQTSPENQLTPEALSNGYRVSYEALGISDKGELELSLCNEAEQWAPASVASYRKVVLQQLRTAYRTHKAKRKAGVLYDVSLDGASLSTAIVYPPQHTVGETARQQWVQDLAGSAPLGSLAAAVPHGFMRGKLFDMLAEEQVPLPRAVWFIQVVYLNRFKPEGWDGGARLPARCSQCSEDLLTYLDQSASALSTTAGIAGPSDPPAAACGTASPAQARWQYVLRLVGGLLCHGLLHVPALLSWLLGRATSLPAGLQMQLLPVLHLMLREVAQSPPLLRQLVEACIKLGSASPHAPTSPEPPAAAPSRQPAAAAAAALVTAALLPTQPGTMLQQGQQQEHQIRSEQQAQQEELRQGYADVVVALLPLAPLAFVPLDAATLSALQSVLEGRSRHSSSRELLSIGEAAAVATAAALLREVGSVQQRLASSVSPRVLRLPDARAMQLLDEQLRSCDAPAAHAELWKLLLPPAPSTQAQQQAQRDLVCLVCSWAVSHPAAGMAAVLEEHLQQQQQELQPGQLLLGSEQGGEGEWAWDAELVPGRALLALAILKHHIQQQGQQQQQQSHEPGGEQRLANQGLQDAYFGWLDWEAQQLREPPEGQPGAQQPLPAKATVPRHHGDVAGRAAGLVSSRRAHRACQWATMLAVSGLLSPSHYLQSLLATGVLHRAAQQAQQGLGPRAQFYLGLLQEFHPALTQQQQQEQQQQPAPVTSPPAASTPPAAAGQKRKLSGEPAGPQQASATPAATAAAAAAAAPGSGDPAQPDQKPDASQAQGAAQTQQGLQAQQQQRAAVEAYAALRRATLQQYACGTGKGQRGGAAAQRSSRSRSGTPPVPDWTTQLRAASMATADTSDATSLGGDTEAGWGSRMDREPSISLASTTWANSGWRQRRCGTGGTGSMPAALRQLKERLEHLLGLRQAGALPAVAVEPLPAVEAGGDGLQRQLWWDALEDIRGLRAWQQRHLATWLFNSSRQHMKAALPPSNASATAAAVAAPSAGNGSTVITASGSSTAPATVPTQAGPTLGSAWLLNVLGALDACGGYREAADLLCDLLAALLRTLASAVLSTASSPGQAAASPPGAQARLAPTSTAVWGAQVAFWHHTGLSPSLVFGLVSAQHQRLAMLGRVPRLLRMLTAGLWTLVPPASHRQHPQHAQQQSAAGRPADPRLAQRQQQDPRQAQHDAQQAQLELLSCCHGQLALAGELLSIYGGTPGTTAAAVGSNRPGSAGQGGRGSQASGPAAAAGGANAGVQQWLGEVEKQHGVQHWLLAAVRRLAAEAAAARAMPAGAQQVGDRAGPGAAGNSIRGQAGMAGPRIGGFSAAASPALAASDVLALMQRVAGAPGLLQEALAQLQGLRLSSIGDGAVREGHDGRNTLLVSAWEAADQLAAWASQRASLAANSRSATFQEMAAAAVLAVFASYDAAAVRTGTAGMAADVPAAGVSGAQEIVATSDPGASSCVWGHLECLARLLELLRRQNRQALLPGFLPAVVVAAAQRTFQEGDEPDKLAPAHPRPPLLLLLVAISHGVVPLEACLAKASGLGALLLANPWALSGVGTGEAWALSCFQRCLPPAAAAEALLTATDSSSAPSQSSTGPVIQQGPSQAALTTPVSPYVREACLSSPRQLYTALTRRALAAAGAAAAAQASASNPGAGHLKEMVAPYPPLEAALTCTAGTAWRPAGPGAGAESGLLSAVLAGAEPATLPLCWLVVRGLLDEQAFQAALRRGESWQSALASTATYQAGGAAAAAALAGRDGHGSLSEPEKDFTSRILAELAERPQSAGVLCALCSEAGRGLADYLLQQLDWVLQDGDSIMGRHSLAAVLARRGALISTPAFKPTSAPNVPRAVPNPQHGTAQTQGQPQLPLADEPSDRAGVGSSTSGRKSSSSEDRAFGVEQGFIEAALVCLAASSDARRRGFAQQLVQQLHRVAEVVARLAPPSAAVLSSIASQGAPAQEQGEGGLGQPGGQGRQGSDEERPGEARSPGTYTTASQPASAPAAAAAAAGLTAGSRPGSGRGGWGRAATAAAGWGAGGRGALRGGKPSTEPVGSVVGVQVAVWLRLGILFPLLPLVYSDPSQDPVTGLRGQLLSVATRLLGSPYITATPDTWPASDPQAPAAAAAVELAGEPLPARLLHILHALAGNSWAAWLQGGRQLRDVPPYEGGRQLALTIEGLPAPKRLKLAAAAALPAAATALATLPSAALQGPTVPMGMTGAVAGEPQQPQAVPAAKAAARADPWLLMPGGATGADTQFKQAGSGSQQVPYWLQGAVRVKRRDLTYGLTSA